MEKIWNNILSNNQLQKLRTKLKKKKDKNQWMFPKRSQNKMLKGKENRMLKLKKT